MKQFLIIYFILFSSIIYAQYTPGAVNYGLNVIKTFDSKESIGGGARLEYAYNCYTTYLAEFNNISNAGENGNNYSELALGVNLILFNWHPLTITAGMGYAVNNDLDFDEDEATLFFKTGNLNNGVQVKLRSLYKVSGPVHIFGELNLKSLGANYHNFLVGFNYNFNPRR